MFLRLNVTWFKSVKPAKLHGRLITPVFQDYKNGQYKIISFYAKQARGLMARWAALHKVDIPEALQDFNLAGYQFDSSESDPQRWVFRRRAE